MIGDISFILDEYEHTERKGYEETEGEKKGRKLRMKIIKLRELGEARTNNQFYWEKLEEYVEMELERNGGDACASNWRYTMDQYRDRLSRHPKKRYPRIVSEVDPNAYVWDFTKLGRDVWNTIMDLIPPDDGNWLSIFLVNREWNRLMYNYVDPNRRIYGQHPLQYSAHKSQLESVKRLMDDDRVNVECRDAFELKNGNRIPFGGGHPLLIAAENCWEEGFLYLLKHPKYQKLSHSLVQCLIHTRHDQIYTACILHWTIEGQHSDIISNSVRCQGESGKLTQMESEINRRGFFKFNSCTIV